MDRTQHLFMPPSTSRRRPRSYRRPPAPTGRSWRGAGVGRVTKFAGSDAAHLGSRDPGLLYGPGAFLSRPDERVEVRDIVTAARVYALVAADLCNRPVA